LLSERCGHRRYLSGEGHSDLREPFFDVGFLPSALLDEDPFELSARHPAFELRAQEIQ
jgi:hypothetical protein